MHALDLVSVWAMPLLLIGIPLHGALRGLQVFEIFVEGAEEGLRTAFRIAPYLVGILFAIGVLRDSGALEALLEAVSPLFGALGFPTAVLPLLLVRPLSGGASLGVLQDILRQYGPDSGTGLLASTLQGSTDTTFYVLTVYFGSVGIRKTRYALSVGLIGDLAGFLGSLLAVRLAFGSV